MFVTATRQYWSLLCNVGGGSSTDKGKLHGLGCLLSPNHAVTARHVWDDVKGRYQWPVILKYDGLFRCRIVHDAVDLDVMFLEADACLDGSSSRQAPTQYPQVYPDWPPYGLSVGFLTRMTLRNSGVEEQRYSAFSQASVSMHLKKKDTDPPWFAISGGIFQKGSSGGPVYTADGQLLGVIIQSHQFVADFDHQLPTIINTPVVAPLYPLLSVVKGLRSNA